MSEWLTLGDVRAQIGKERAMVEQQQAARVRAEAERWKRIPFPVRWLALSYGIVTVDEVTGVPSIDGDLSMVPGRDRSIIEAAMGLR